MGDVYQIVPPIFILDALNSPWFVNGGFQRETPRVGFQRKLQILRKVVGEVKRPCLNGVLCLCEIYGGIN